MSWDDTVEKYEELTVDLPSAAADELRESVRSLETVAVSDLTEPVLGDSRTEAVADD
jgi:hypothetical protein